MRRRLALLALAAVPVVAAACGGEGDSDGTGSRAEKTADCLNQLGYLVTAAESAVAGTTPGGITFVVSVPFERTTIDDSGNPPARQGGKPARLSTEEREQIQDCADSG